MVIQLGGDTGKRRCATFNGSSEATLKLYTCAKCHVARYCGQACQKAAWGAHRAACKRRQAHLAQVGLPTSAHHGATCGTV